jgi:MFS family permease
MASCLPAGVTDIPSVSTLDPRVLTEGAGGRVFGVLRIRDYRLVISGQLLSNLGDWLLLVAAPYYVFRLTGSTLATGLSMAAETVPALLLGPVAGVLADRWDRRRTMLAADLLRAATVALMLLVRHPGQVWLIYAALLVEGAFSQFFNPARQALVPALVGRGAELSSANSLAALVSGTVRLLGGPAGGALYATAGFAPVVALDAGSYLTSAALITAVGFRPARAAASAVAAPAAAQAAAQLAASAAAPAAGKPARAGRLAWRRFAGELRAGATQVRVTPGLAALLASAGVMLVGNGELSALLVPYTGTVLHAGAGALGWLFSALGAGFLLGAPLSRVVAGRLSQRTVLVGSLAALSLAFAVSFNIHDAAWDLPLFALIGPPAVCFLVTVDTFIARSTPDGLLGRVSSFYGMVQAAATLGGMLAGSALGQWLGTGVTIDLAAVTVALAAALSLAVPRHGPATAAIAADHISPRAQTAGGTG